MKKIISMILIMFMVFGITIFVNKNIQAEIKEANKNQSSGDPVIITTYNYTKEPVKVTLKESPKDSTEGYENSIEILLALGLGEKIASVPFQHDIKD